MISLWPSSMFPGAAWGSGQLQNPRGRPGFLVGLRGNAGLHIGSGFPWGHHHLQKTVTSENTFGFYSFHQEGWGEGYVLQTGANLQGADCPPFGRRHQALSAERGGDGGAEIRNSRPPSATPGPLYKCTEFLKVKQKFGNLKPDPPPRRDIPRMGAQDGSGSCRRTRRGGKVSSSVQGSRGAPLFHILQAADDCSSRSTGMLAFLGKMARRESTIAAVRGCSPWKVPAAPLQTPMGAGDRASTGRGTGLGRLGSSVWRRVWARWAEPRTCW